MRPKTAYPDIQLVFRPLYFENVPTEHNFEMPLVKFQSLYALGVHCKLQARGKYIKQEFKLYNKAGRNKG